MNDKSLQKAANITVVLNAIYNMQNRADIPRSKLRELEPAKKSLENEFWNLLAEKSSEKTLGHAEDDKIIANRLAEAKAALAEEKKNKKAVK